MALPPDRCIACNAPRERRGKGKFIYYVCGAVAPRNNSEKFPIFSTCPRAEELKEKRVKNKPLLNGSFQFDGLYNKCGKSNLI